MSNKLTVKVTKTDIKNGVCGSETLCPIARAVRRQTKTRVVVDGVGMTVGRLGHGGREYFLPVNAEEFIWNFDAGNRVKPFKFVATQ